MYKCKFRHPRLIHYPYLLRPNIPLLHALKGIGIIAVASQLYQDNDVTPFTLIQVEPNSTRMSDNNSINNNEQQRKPSMHEKQPGRNRRIEGGRIFLKDINMCRFHRPSTDGQKPKPEYQNLKTKDQNPKTKTRSPKPEDQNPKTKTRRPKPKGTIHKLRLRTSASTKSKISQFYRKRNVFFSCMYLIKH